MYILDQGDKLSRYSQVRLSVGLSVRVSNKISEMVRPRIIKFWYEDFLDLHADQFYFKFWIIDTEDIKIFITPIFLQQQRALVFVGFPIHSFHAHIYIHTHNRTYNGIYFIYECIQYTHALIHFSIALILHFFSLSSLLRSYSDTCQCKVVASNIN